MFNTSRIELSRSAVTQNFSFLKSLFGEDIIISSVVKGNAYGHGLHPFVTLVHEIGIRHFSVYSASEAVEVYNCVNGSARILVMGDLSNDGLEWAIRHGIEFFVFNFQRLEYAIKTARKYDYKARIHIEFETGMNRTGFASYELEKLSTLLKSNRKYIELVAACTHFAGAESIANQVRIENQIKRYNENLETMKREGHQLEMEHTCCSAAAVRFEKMRKQMVRIGILQYGFWPSREVFIDYVVRNKLIEDPLKRVISWKSKVMSIKAVQIGEFIGYGTTYLVQKDMKIAIVPVGYSHGFSRSLSNQGRVLVRGMRVSVIGIVNMNCIAVDVSDVPVIEIGDEVVLIGKQGNLDITVASFGELSEQLNYELLTRLPLDIPRVIVD